MIHDRHYTAEEANAMLPQLEPMLDELRDARDRLTEKEVHEVLSGAAPGNGGGEAGRRVGEAFLELRRLVGGLQELGLVIRDIDRGLIDFPAIIEGREAYLCWRRGEDEVGHWHDLDAGYRGRRPLA